MLNLNKHQQFADFGEAVFEMLKEALYDDGDCSIEALLDAGVDVGLVEQVSYAPEKHGEDDDLEPGDLIYWIGEDTE